MRGFLHDTAELYEAADAEGQEWAEFIQAWGGRYGDRWASASELRKLAVECELLGTIIGDKTERSQQVRLGKALGKLRDRQFGSRCVRVGSNSDTGSARYRLQDVSDPGGGTTRGA